MKAHLFNPENDLALASGTVNYTPPPSVRRFKEALAQLPRWYAEEGDIILCGSSLDEDLQAVPAPWGWSANAVRQFERAGIKGPFPDVDLIRRMSHRRSALLLHKMLADAGLPYPLTPEPREITDINDITSNQIFLKSPWSCSGRGVFDGSNMSIERIREVAAGVIRRQGSIMVEPRLPKNSDFALLFDSEKQAVKFKGISSFFTSSANTAYGGNFCASQEEIRDKLNARFIDETISAVTNALNSLIAPFYEGSIGVDMITYGQDNLICPTIEINLRQTMGFVALSLYKRLGRGIFRVGRSPMEGILLVDPNPYFSATFQPLS